MYQLLFTLTLSVAIAAAVTWASIAVSYAVQRQYGRGPVKPVTYEDIAISMGVGAVIGGFVYAVSNVLIWTVRLAIGA